MEKSLVEGVIYLTWMFLIHYVEAENQTEIVVQNGTFLVELQCLGLPPNATSLTWGRYDSGKFLQLVDYTWNETFSVSVFHEHNVDKYSLNGTSLMISNVSLADVGVYICNSSDHSYLFYIKLAFTELPTSPKNKNSNLGLIIGLSVGLPVAFLIILMVCLLVYRKRKGSQNNRTEVVHFKLGNATKRPRSRHGSKKLATA